MARILLLDPDERARRALHGILARGNHHLVGLKQVSDAWEFIRRNPGIDMVFTELVIGPAHGLEFVQRLKNDCLLKLLPVVIYTGNGDRTVVKRAIDLRVQNFLIKPYHDDAVFAEIDKAAANPWRDRFFEEEKSFCKLMGLTPEQLHGQLDLVQQAVTAARGALEKAAAMHSLPHLLDAVNPLHQSAEAAGAWGLVECLDQMAGHAGEDRWSAFESDLEAVDFAGRMIHARLNPEHAGVEFLGQDESDAQAYRAERETWQAALAAGRTPVVPWEQIQREVLALRGCPVIDSAAADFQMAANGHPSCINPLMDLVARDPGLSAQMLAAANRAHPATEAFNRIEDARLAVGQLGEILLETEARGLLIADERAFNLAPAFTWPWFWTFQRGVARVAQLICKDLEFYSLEPIARTGGQLHDIGKLILAHLHPGGFQAVLEHARVERRPLSEVEQRCFGGTTAEIGGLFATHQNLSPRLANVMRWLHQPERAGEDKVLVAIVSLARELCRHNQVGTSGDPMREHPLPLEETPEWQILREGLYPSFDLRKFELQVHAYCGQLRNEFSGHQAGTIAELVGATR